LIKRERKGLGRMRTKGCGKKGAKTLPADVSVLKGGGEVKEKRNDEKNLFLNDKREI
jgi:hypothetical protein